MNSQNHGEKENKVLTAVRDKSVPNAGEPSAAKREMNDEEMANISAGMMRALNPQPLPP